MAKVDRQGYPLHGMLKAAQQTMRTRETGPVADIYLIQSTYEIYAIVRDISERPSSRVGTLIREGVTSGLTMQEITNLAIDYIKSERYYD